MEEAVEQDPANENAWAFLGELSLLAFLFNQSTRGNPMIQGLKCAHTALRINPLSQHAHITLGMANIFSITNRRVWNPWNMRLIESECFGVDWYYRMFNDQRRRIQPGN